jgi:hypothetical protein
MVIHYGIRVVIYPFFMVLGNEKYRKETSRENPLMDYEVISFFPLLPPLCLGRGEILRRECEKWLSDDRTVFQCPATGAGT